MTRIQNTLAALAIGASALVAGTAVHAQTATPAPATPAATTPAPAAPMLTIRQVYDKMEAAGYRNISEIERSRKHGYEVKAYDPQGQRVKLYVDPQSGAVTRSRFDD
ncbi:MULTISPECIES: PepSY domain-containing protein [Achromobacter]|uniref:PepSY domain-containing protein n=1 Tax=Achromobacter spanius TaxID=217203 RepID=A0ABY8H176_9BURK|nr:MULTISPECIES: PepSY domain-containing protein [Achromobacter]WAI85376.1 PepSY domain-containing protein [Achromobacter spanius]WEX95459.1 PepSY domain-containing protein [Achromobacter sp. SS2-2022]WFP10821.1 PepSY domain-containing protein [Achromobacter spanius]